MQLLIHLDGHPVTLNIKDFEDTIDVDQLTAIDYSNLYGEAVTVSALLNHVGILKVGQEKIVEDKKLELSIYEANFKQSARKSAVSSGDKMTENGLSEKLDCDAGVIVMKKNLINAEYLLGVVNAMLVAIKSKDKKLDNLTKGVTPEELWNELVEGKINNMMIKKHKSITGK